MVVSRMLSLLMFYHLAQLAEAAVLQVGKLRCLGLASGQWEVGTACKDKWRLGRRQVHPGDSREAASLTGSEQVQAK